VNVIPCYQLGRCVEFLECSKIINKVCKKGVMLCFALSLGTRPVLRNTSGGTHHVKTVKCSFESMLATCRPLKST